MKRREFIGLVGGRQFGRSWPVHSNLPKMKRVAIVHPSTKVGDLSNVLSICVYRKPYPGLSNDRIG
jgi:hypothetical protein